ncbi:LysM peptidoglycan-binding domain-containing protein [Liquorilactobacillus nagelii]|jgi:LysM repeat protein|uniref:LysM peptidoglycan-binding domain-containing protein n=1 Tax=Liquorilactobacillus nagelii TaxID=82688 RepID=UPI00242C4859|nr:LysM domain-containing protein [Liquorilactobacillus nagelii]MCI1700429.1 LysM peptidoglycan-binding domain-containing protein [Liquorilactobacillus nagelii]
MSRRSKHQVNKKVWLGILLVVILLIVGFIGFRSRVVNARIQSFFGDNQTAQKIEYQKQRQTAQKKYGKVSQSSNSSSTKKTQKSYSSTNRTEKHSSSSAVTSSSKNGSYRYYVVKSGDTLSSIAANYGTTATAIMNLNDLTTGTISTGTTLKLPAAASSTGTNSTYTSSNTTTNE